MRLRSLIVPALLALCFARPVVADPTEGWRFETAGGAEAALTADDGALKTDIATAGDKDWHVQLFRPGQSIKNGLPHVVSFAARADRARGMRVLRLAGRGSLAGDRAEG
jgi:hypothetical protein